MAAKKPHVTEMKSVSEARRTFDSLNRVYRGETRIVIERNSILVGAVVSARDLELLRERDEQAELARTFRREHLMKAGVN